MVRRLHKIMRAKYIRRGYNMQSYLIFIYKQTKIHQPTQQHSRFIIINNNCIQFVIRKSLI